MKNSLVFLSIILWIACDSSTIDIEANLESLRQTDAKYKEYVAAQDMDNWISFYAPEAIIYPANSSPITGLDNIAAMGNRIASIPDFNPVFELKKIELSSDGTLGYTSSHLTNSYTSPNGETITETGPDFHVWKKQEDGLWKIVIDIWNSDQPKAKPEIPMEEVQQ